MIARVGGIEVRAGGTALQGGGHGDRVRARNSVSGRVVEGVVQPDGTIAVNP
jgi:flagellar basal body P-ring formation protein FlgA